MLYFLSRTISPKLIPSQNHLLLWISLRFISTTSISKAHSFTLSYLINTCGFSPQRAASISKQISFETRKKPDSVILFFNKLGLSQTQLLTVFGTVPRYLCSDPNKTFVPKIQFLKSKGFSDSDIPNIIYRCPEILKRSLEKQIIPCFDFFDTIFRSKDKLMKVIIGHPGILFDVGTRSAPNIRFLREEGVPESHVIRLLEYKPATLKAMPKRFKVKVEEVKRLGFSPLLLNFVVALYIVNSRNKSVLVRKEDIYRRWGWSDDEIRAAFRVHPHCMAISEDKIEAVMDYVVNKMGYETSAVARYPVMVSMSLGKRIIPRGSIIQVLRSKGLVDQLSLNAIYNISVNEFLDKFISSHEREAGELLKLYQAKMALSR